MSGTLSDWMSRIPVCAGPDELLSVCARRMATTGVRHLPVVRAGAPVGLITDTDLAAHGTLAGADDVWVPWSTSGPATAGEVASPPVVAPSDLPIDDALNVLLQDGGDALMVVDASGVLVGVFTEHDGVRVAAARVPADRQARSIGSAPAISLPLEAPATEGWALMERHRIRHLLLTRDGALAGVISARDMLCEGVHEGRDLTCEEVTRSLDVAALDLDATVGLALAALVDLRIGCAPLVDATGFPHAVVTRTDALRAALG